jgi:phosphatidylinositol glycan class S
LSFAPAYTELPPPNSRSQDSIAEAVDKASQGDAGAEQVAEVLLQDEQRDKAYVIGEEEMKVFVNSEKWSLGMSAISSAPITLAWHGSAIRSS